MFFLKAQNFNTHYLHWDQVLSPLDTDRSHLVANTHTEVDSSKSQVHKVEEVEDESDDVERVSCRLQVVAKEQRHRVFPLQIAHCLIKIFRYLIITLDALSPFVYPCSVGLVAF